MKEKTMANTKVDHTPWLHSRQALVVRAVIAFVLAYALGSKALDTGSYWQYLGTVIALIFGIKFIVQSFKHGKKV